MVGVDGARVDIEVIGVAPGGVEVRVLRRDKAEPAGHPEQVCNAHGAPWVIWLLPLVHRCWRPQVVHTLMDQLTHQGRREALAHGPTRQACRRVESTLVTLRNNAAFVCDHECCGECLGGIACCHDTRGHLCGIYLGGQRRSGKLVAQGPGVCCRVGKRRLHPHRGEEDGVRSTGQCDASLVPVELGVAGHPVWEGQVHCVALCVHDRIDDRASFGTR